MQTTHQQNLIKDIAFDCIDLEPSGYVALIESKLRDAKSLNETEKNVIKQEVLSLLQYTEDDSFMAKPAVINKPEFFAAATNLNLVDRMVGPYRIKRRLGEGGMSSVWLGEQETPSGPQQAAIKIPTARLGDTAFLERLKRESALQSNLNHPNIARWLSIGQTIDGGAYLALEFIDGVNIVDYCKQKPLNTRQRLHLFLQVLMAVEYAHGQMVLHRDLKPTNILVNLQGQAKLLDFGIAKLLDAQGTVEETAFTRLTGRAITLQYASPEQVAGQPLGIPSDIYALGVILFELLTNNRPYKLQRGSAAELEEAVLSGDTVKPSEAIGLMTDLIPINTEYTDDNSASLKQVSIKKSLRWRQRLRNELRGDLDTITLKALQKSPQNRYASAQTMREDIQRYLDGLPILARADSFTYRCRKFVQRHMIATTASIVIASSILIGSGLSLWQAREAKLQSAIAKTEATRSAAVQSFLASLFDKNKRAQSSPVKARAMTVQELLLEASGRVEKEFVDTPLLKAELLTTVGKQLLDIEEHGRAFELFSQADSLIKSIEPLNRTVGVTDELRINTLAGLIQSARLTGKAEKAREARMEILALAKTLPLESHALRGRALNASPGPFAVNQREEEAIFRQSVQLHDKYLSKSQSRISAHHVLAQILRLQGRFSEAREEFLAAISAFDETGSNDKVARAELQAWGAFCASRIGRLDLSVAEYPNALITIETELGSLSLNLQFHKSIYAEILISAGYFAKAEPIFSELLRPDFVQNPRVAQFDATVYYASALNNRKQAVQAKDTLLAMKPYVQKFGAMFPINGGQWYLQLAHSQALLGEHDAARLTLASLNDASFTYDKKYYDYRTVASQVALLSGNPAAAWRELTMDGTASIPTVDLNKPQLNDAAMWLHYQAARVKFAQQDFVQASHHINIAVHLFELIKPKEAYAIERAELSQLRLALPKMTTNPALARATDKQ